MPEFHDRRIVSEEEFESLFFQTDLFDQAAVLFRDPYGEAATQVTDQVAEDILKEKPWWQFPTRRRGHPPRILVVAAVIRAIRKYWKANAPKRDSWQTRRYLITERAISMQVLGDGLPTVTKKFVLHLSEIGIICGEHCPWVQEIAARKIFHSYCNLMVSGHLLV
jgi:hypothetical protein